MKKLAELGIAAVRHVYVSCPVDVLRVAALVEISAAAASLARTIVKLNHLDPAGIAPYVSDPADMRAVLGRGRWLPTMIRHVPEVNTKLGQHSRRPEPAQLPDQIPLFPATETEAGAAECR
ncbi:hypothetical protein [Catenuloplanes niger]